LGKNEPCDSMREVIPQNKKTWRVLCELSSYSIQGT